MSKQICILTSAHPAFNIRIFYKEAKTLVKAGYDVTLIAQHNKNEIMDGIKIIALPKPKNRFFRMFFLTRKVYKLALKQKANIYHFHDPELIPIGLLLKIFTKSKIIYDVHENYKKNILSRYWVPKLLRKPLAIIFDLFEKKVSNFFDAVIVVDNFLASEFDKKAERVRNCPYFVASDVSIKKEQIFTCIYVGKLSKERGLIEIVKSIEYLTFPIRLILLGRFSDKIIKKEIETMEGFKKVAYLGFKPWSETITYLSSADVGLIIFQPTPAHLYVGEGNTKLFEYMMVGLPVVSSSFPGLKRIIQENKCGICVCSTSPKKISEAIKYLYENPDVRKKMGENGRRAVLEKYNWENEAKKLLKVYEKLLKR